MARPKKNPDADAVADVMPDAPVVLCDMNMLCRVFDTSRTTVNTYIAKGLIVGTRGKYDLIASSTNLIKYLRQGASKQNDGTGLKEGKLEEEIRQLRLQNAKAEGQLVDVNSVHTIVRKTLIGTADWLESLPDAFEQTGIINPGMTDDFIRVMDNQREMLMSINLKDIALDGSDEPGEPQ